MLGATFKKINRHTESKVEDTKISFKSHDRIKFQLFIQGSRNSDNEIRLGFTTLNTTKTICFGWCQLKDRCNLRCVSVSKAR